MPFQAGVNDSETGGFGFTKSNANVGLTGRADPVNPQDEAVPGGAGGCGVFGFSKVRKAAGVFGVNDTDEGRGVQGNGPEAGVGGFSEAGNGVLAQSNSGDAVLATTNGLNKSAVFASNNGQGDAPQGGPPAGNGVFGLTFVRGGTGVFGANNSAKGRGVQGNGPEAGVGGFRTMRQNLLGVLY